MTLKTYNNIDSKTKTLFTLYEKVLSFEFRNKNIVSLGKKTRKLVKRGIRIRADEKGEYFSFFIF